MRHFRSAFVRSAPMTCAALTIGAFALASFGPHHSVARAETSVQDDSKQDDLKQNFLKEHELGRRFRIDPADLPAPKTGPIVTNRALIVPYAGQVPQVPTGFTATPFATGLVNPRRLLVLPNGDVIVAEQSAGYLTLLRDDGERPCGVDRPPCRGSQQTLRSRLAGRSTCWSPTRTGSGACRIVSARCARAAARATRRPSAAGGAQAGCRGVRRQEWSPRRASSASRKAIRTASSRRSENRRALRRCRLLGQCRRRARSRRRRSSASMRTARIRRPMPRACATRPRSPSSRRPAISTRVVQERDGLGDSLPSDYLTRVQQGGFYGWPYAYIGKHPQAGFANLAPDKVRGDDRARLLVRGAFFGARLRVL